MALPASARPPGFLLGGFDPRPERSQLTDAMNPSSSPASRSTMLLSDMVSRTNLWETHLRCYQDTRLIMAVVGGDGSDNRQRVGWRVVVFLLRSAGVAVGRFATLDFFGPGARRRPERSQRASAINLTSCPASPDPVARASKSSAAGRGRSIITLLYSRIQLQFSHQLSTLDRRFPVFFPCPGQVGRQNKWYVRIAAKYEILHPVQVAQ